MIPDPEDMIQMVTLVEQRMNLLGWDGDPTLGLALRYDDTIESILTPWQPGVVSPKKPAEGLHLIAALLRKHKNLFDDMPGDIIAGLWYVCEGWALPPEKVIEGRAAIDTPGAFECRTCVLVDCAGRLYQVDRIRGKDPQLRMDPPGWPTYAKVPEGLRRILCVLAECMSPGMADLEGLSGA